MADKNGKLITWGLSTLGAVAGFSVIATFSHQLTFGHTGIRQQVKTMEETLSEVRADVKALGKGQQEIMLLLRSNSAAPTP